MKTYWLIPGFTLLLLGAGCALSKSQTNQPIVEKAPIRVPPTAKTGDSQINLAMPSATVVGQAPLPATDGLQPTHVITMNGGEFFFDPSSITAQAGETMTINFGAVTGQHIFTIDELKISKQMTPGGSVTFTVPATPGRYTYYCSVGAHKTLGMTGTLIVE